MVHGRRGPKPLREAKSGRERTADAILAASALAAAGAAFLPPSFGSGLFFHAALAAAVGGAADWFAVNSLFHRPLGIPFRTELVPRSRDKIIRMARVMVTEEILTVPRLYRVLKDHSLSAAFLPWIETHRAEVRKLCGQVILAGLEALDAEKMADRAMDAAALTAEHIDWAALLQKALPPVGGDMIRSEFLAGLQHAGEAFLEEGLTEEELLSIYHRAWSAYERGGRGRSMLRGLLQSQAGLTDEKAAVLIREKLRDWAASLGDPQSGAGQKLIAEYDRFRARLDDEAFRKRINSAVRRYGLPLLRTEGAAWLIRFLEAHREDGAEAAAAKLVQQLEERLQDETVRRRTDRWLLRQAADHLPRLHERIGDAVEKALSGYSGEAMADLVESNVWHDLQMIRINGSLIGAVLGGLSYAAFYAATGGAAL